MKVAKVMQSGSVERFHTAPGISSQSVAQHSWGVAILIQHLFPDCSKDLILAALTHDCSEMMIGDIPSTAKWRSPDLKKLLDQLEEQVEVEWGIHFWLSDEEKAQLKIADCLEGMTYCLSQYKMGEEHAKVIFFRWVKFVEENLYLEGESNRYFKSLISDMEAQSCQ